MRSFHRAAIFLLVGLICWLAAGCDEDCDRCPTQVPVSPHVLVKPDGTGDHATIQDALDAAADLDVIELADGTFRGEGNRDLDLLGKNVTVRSRGGIAENCIVDCEGSETDPHLGFLFFQGETSLAALQGITIRGAYGIAGGAVICDRSSPTIVDCRFVENYAMAGAGLKCSNDAAPLVLNCVFSENSAEAGAAVLIQWASPYFVNCEFRNNQATVEGGAMATQSSSFTMSRCLFDGNHADEAGGGLRVLYDAPILTEVVFTGNSAGVFGGGLSLEDVEGASLRECSIIGNTSGSAAGGLHSSGTLQVERCLIADNTAQEFGGGMGLAASATVSYCTLAGNAAPEGAGILVAGEAVLTLEGGIVAFNGSGAAISCSINATAVLSCCDVYGNIGDDWVGCLEGQGDVDNNFSADPLFVDADMGDYRLEAGSPCRSVTGCGTIGWTPSRVP